MQEILKFFNHIKRYRYILVIVPIITVIITFFLVRNLSNSYKSQAQIATGIVDETQQQSIIVQALDRDKVNQRFSNLMESMKMNEVLDQVSFQLIIHDLTNENTYVKKSKELLELSSAAQRYALQVFHQKYNDKQSLTLSKPKEKALFDLIESMNYDAASLRKKLLIFRHGDSDFITVQFESENPDLSARVVNLISTEFIKNYSSSLKENQLKANNFLRDLLSEKSDTLSKRMEQLRNYKIRNGVLNLTEQSKQLYTLILDYDTRKQEAVEKTSSYAGALNEIDKKFDPRERKYIESTLSKVNQSITNTREELSSLYDLYINNDLDPGYKSSYDSLSRKLTAQINKSSDEYITNPLNTKQELITQKLNLEIQLDISRYSINSLENKLQALHHQFEKLVPREADVQAFEMNIDIASKEYLDILNKYNQSSLESSFSTQMNVVQPGVPGLAQPSKKMLLVLLSGIITFMICVLVIFFIFFFDNSIYSSQELADATDKPVIGKIDKLMSPSLALQEVWKPDAGNSGLAEFKNQLRSIRYEVEKMLNDKVILITSISPFAGKTLVTLNLAMAWKMTNKKVLVIDGNFAHPEITTASSSNFYLEDFFTGKIDLPQQNLPGSITILGNKGGDTSLLELATIDSIKAKIELAKELYDIILIEASSLHDLNQSKEWILFTQHLIAVFEAGNTITDSQNKYINYLEESGTFLGWINNKELSNQA